MLLEKIQKNIDNPDELSKLLIEAVGTLYYLGTRQHEANLEFAQAVITEITQSKDKKMSVAEAERRALVSTGGKVNAIRYEREALQELINAIKMRLKVLEVELNLSQNS
jgi:hypothetical protein